MFKRFWGRVYNWLVWFMDSSVPTFLMLEYFLGVYITYRWFVVGNPPTFLGFLIWWFFLNQQFGLMLREIKR